MKIAIKASENASQRTKNRIKEHPGLFEIVDNRHIDLFHSPATLLRHEDGWFGWLPDDEFDIAKVAA